MSGCRLSPIRLGLSFGVIWGFSLFIMGMLAYLYAYGNPFVAAIGSLYLGYEPSIKGSIIGGAIGFIDAFITGFLIGWLYNLFGCCGACCKKEDKSGCDTKD